MSLMPLETPVLKVSRPVAASLTVLTLTRAQADTKDVGLQQM